MTFPGVVRVSYSTCSIHKVRRPLLFVQRGHTYASHHNPLNTFHDQEENEHVVRALLEANPDYRLVHAIPSFPGRGLSTECPQGPFAGRYTRQRLCTRLFFNSAPFPVHDTYQARCASAQSRQRTRQPASLWPYLSERRLSRLAPKDCHYRQQRARRWLGQENVQVKRGATRSTIRARRVPRKPARHSRPQCRRLDRPHAKRRRSARPSPAGLRRA